jgi:putative acetyltransferase
MIRLARFDDALAIHNVHTRSVGQLCSANYPKEVINGWLEGRSPEGYRGIAKAEMYVFEENGVVVGFSHVKRGAIIALFVDPAHVRKGIGRALFEHALPIARGGSHAALPFEVTLTAVPFYVRCGCKEVARGSVRKNAVEVETVTMLLPETANQSLQPTAGRSDV